MSHRFWLVSLLILAAFLRIWLASTDTFLHEWDERYHALVARNLLLHPLMPTLYETPLLEYDFREWASNHIWLSKPPLPLWLIGLSLKLWGFTEWAVRFPSILFSLGCVGLTYLIAKNLWGRKVTLWATFFHAIHGLTLEVGSGRFSSDHVDTMFLFWIELGFWAMVRYYLSPTQAAFNRYVILIGISTGLAFMCKWTAAFMLPLVWAMTGIVSGKTLKVTMLKDWLLAFLAFLVVALPWPVYIFQQYPKEAMSLLEGVVSPVTETVQGHSGEWYFYLQKSGRLFGQAIYLPMLWLLWAMFQYFRKPSKLRFNRVLLFCWTFVPLALLSIAATKRQTYLLCAAPAFFMLTALFMRLIVQRGPNLGYPRILVRVVWAALLILPIRYAVERSKVFFDRDTRPGWAQQLKKLVQEEKSPKTVIFNEPHSIEAMFYTGFTAYPWIPSDKKLVEIRQEGWRILECQNGNYIER